MKISISATPALLLATALLFFSCKKDPCADVNCNNGDCMEGVCLCAEGYEGAACDVAVRDKFIGAFLPDYQGCITPSPDHRVTITADASNAGAVRVLNLGDYACPGGSLILNATISGDSLLIAEQTIDCGVIAYTFSGAGRISGQLLTLSYTAKYPAQPQPRTDNCVVKLEKQL